ncbi:hypothetical protein F3Y22_tig00110831pilonHSYRG00736 [Hibiscus syriacus]|uniref:NAB domain-containing protein n=1 Tax=Hibiscus syriacus TaxID=106335 RepID=A0A6A2ZM28_HIBSY|nr:hypothetical protein F3Y22_tig00110831pilonHSYRG00736 [Hibiscus syriacus]
MEKEEQEEEEAALLSRVDSQALRQQSQWLQTILYGIYYCFSAQWSLVIDIDSMEHTNVTACNDLDTKINLILSIIVQDDGDTFSKRAEMYYQKRPELVGMVEELQKSYRLLAEKYDQLRSQGMQNHVHGEEGLKRVRYSNFGTKSTAGDPDHEIEFDQDHSNGMFTAAEFEVSELVKDNMSQQDELIKRNKNGKTSELSHEVPAKRTRPRLSWLKRLFCGRSMKSDAS